MRLRLAYVVALALALGGCGVPGHTYHPAVANKPLPVTFYSGRVVSVIDAAIGFPEGGAAITVGVRPFEIVGAHVRAGPQPAGGKASVTVAGIDIGPEVGAPAAALEYTVALEGSPQIIQITQARLAEDFQLWPPTGAISPGSQVVVRVVGATARVLPLDLVPHEFRNRIVHAPMPLPLGAPPRVLAAPPRFPACDGPDWKRPCYIAHR